jgi:electron transport complex protein RnfA
MYLALALFSALSANLVFQFGLCLGSLDRWEHYSLKIFAFRSAVLFCSVITVWIIVFYMILPLTPVYQGSVFILPLSILGSWVYYHALKRFFLPGGGEGEMEKHILEGKAPSFAASFLTITLASGPAEALMLALGFAGGLFFALLMVREIGRRSMLETVPAFLRGGPLLLVSMGLLSLVFSSAAALFLGALGFF